MSFHPGVAQAHVSSTLPVNVIPDSNWASTAIETTSANSRSVSVASQSARTAATHNAEDDFSP